MFLSTDEGSSGWVVIIGDKGEREASAAFTNKND